MKVRRTYSRQAILLAGCSALALGLGSALAPAYAVNDGNKGNAIVIKKKSVVVSSVTYDPSEGAIASLTAGVTTLAGSKSATSTATDGNNYIDVWNNAAVDGNFGVATAIHLTDINPQSGVVLHGITVPTDQIVGSFSSKSELALSAASDGKHTHIVFMGYAGAALGDFDISNSDAVSGQDPTNPVTHAFGTSYFHHRTIVSMDERGNFVYTPTIAYGGDNPRAAILGSNGLYYSVGNSNAGDANTFAPNGTSPDVTTTTGLEVVNPIDSTVSSAAIPNNNSAEVDPLLQYVINGKTDKAGKDNNYRGITEFGGALYFTKGSGSNGFDTVYTVSSLPTVANAASATISIVPGFPTDPARPGNNYAPFGIFFADANTMYVADEGTGNATDASTHAGLEKWSLINGTWYLDYVLQNGLIGTTDTGLTGAAGQYPDVTTVGLRNLTGVVNKNGTVTLWATTATKSASGDVGADPNRVVKITDMLSATTMTTKVGQEKFRTVMGPTYGTVYRGVAYVP